MFGNVLNLFALVSSLTAVLLGIVPTAEWGRYSYSLHFQMALRDINIIAGVLD